MAFAILRAAKLKTMGNIGGSLAHNYRTIETPNANPDQTANNFHSLKNPEAVKNAISERLPEKRRSDAVLCVEYMITASPEWQGWSDERQNEYFKQAVDWLEQRHGKQNVVATSIHRDETTPHLIAYVVPLDQETGKLNAKKFLGGKAKLAEMQSSFSEQVKNLGLERGIEGSKAKHTRIKEYYAKVNEPTPQLKPVDRPKAGLFETTTQYGNKVVSSVLEQIKPQWESMAKLSKEVKTARKELLDARKTLLELQNKVKPYLDAIRPLDAKQRLKLDSVMSNTSEKLQLERIEAEKKQKAELEQAKLEREKAKQQKELAIIQNIQNMTPAERKAFKQENEHVLSKFQEDINNLAIELYNRVTPENQRVKPLFSHYKLSDMEEIKKFKDEARAKLLENPALVKKLRVAIHMIEKTEEIEKNIKPEQVQQAEIVKGAEPKKQEKGR